MNKNQEKDIKTIITELIISNSDCLDCKYFDGTNRKICEKCFNRDKLILNKENNKYIKEKLTQIKTILK